MCVERVEQGTQDTTHNLTYINSVLHPVVKINKNKILKLNNIWFDCISIKCRFDLNRYIL